MHCLTEGYHATPKEFSLTRREWGEGWETRVGGGGGGERRGISLSTASSLRKNRRGDIKSRTTMRGKGGNEYTQQGHNRLLRCKKGGTLPYRGGPEREDV